MLSDTCQGCQLVLLHDVSLPLGRGMFATENVLEQPFPAAEERVLLKDILIQSLEERVSANPVGVIGDLSPGFAVSVCAKSLDHLGGHLGGERVEELVSLDPGSPLVHLVLSVEPEVLVLPDLDLVRSHVGLQPLWSVALIDPVR